MQETWDMGSIPGSGRSPGGGRGNPLQCSCLENPTDSGAWWAIVHELTDSGTRLKQLSTHMSENSGALGIWVGNLFKYTSRGLSLASGSKREAEAGGGELSQAQLNISIHSIPQKQAVTMTSASRSAPIFFTLIFVFVVFVFSLVAIGLTVGSSYF